MDEDPEHDPAEPDLVEQDPLIDSLDDDGTDPCPHCGAMIYADGEWCPKCGKYLSEEDGPSNTKAWVVIVVAVLIFVTIVMGVFGR